MIPKIDPIPNATRAMAPKDWVVVLAKYREPDIWRSVFELAITAGPFLAIWALAWWSLSLSPWVALGLSILNAAFLLRLFTIQHDCGHGSFFSNRKVSDWVGRVLGVVTLTPYDVWRRTHSEHHSGAGNLSRRGMGDIMTLTVAEYEALTPMGRLQYRIYRHPLMLFGFAPGYLFFLQNRLPLGLTSQRRYWVSAMSTNLALVVILGTVWYFGGLMPLLLIFVPSTLIAATLGMWLFYVQHQFENTQWDQDENWQVHDAALHGSSHYVMPSVLQWFSANIGIHHVHHLYSRIPFYRLPEVLKDHVELEDSNRMTIRESLAYAKLHVWDEKSRKLLSFAQVRALSR
ncbi:fatty acid desaturase [Shimia abyssi]|uniref:Omega-6 fatty acid desaturase (Delta-12 desaturase) n=1 Tax=Shimia abyssi TaxID=1662395 RepID=A0A2P8FAX0_9RHOB|nr:fatty acid desaturase [Shimia abyssi]PSL18883.1 omega-6 fatty acid desaturase (delta-12 desaturase) [Shimia abyssi]